MRKQPYVAPKLDKIATVASLTAAIGSSTSEDQSEWPQAFPPNAGSFDLCHNSDPDETC